MVCSEFVRSDMIMSVDTHVIQSSEYPHPTHISSIPNQGFITKYIFTFEVISDIASPQSAIGMASLTRVGAIETHKNRPPSCHLGVFTLC